MASSNPASELDALIAERVMGERRLAVPVVVGVRPREMWWKIDGTLMEEPPPYSTDIAAAWLVVGAMNAKDFSFHFVQSYATTDVYFKHRDEDDDVAERRELYVIPAEAATAICIAALDALAARSPQSAVVEDSNGLV